MKSLSRLLLFVVAASSIAFSSCGPSGPKTVPVKGTIRWEGAPIATGSITFEDDDPNVVPDAAKIIDGNYEANVKPGSKRIRIVATKPGEQVDEAMGMAPQIQFLPPKYNIQSELLLIIPDQNDAIIYDQDLVP